MELRKISDKAMFGFGYTGVMVAFGVFILARSFTDWLGSDLGTAILVWCYLFVLGHQLGAALFSSSLIAKEDANCLEHTMYVGSFVSLPATLNVVHYGLTASFIAFASAGAYLFYLALLLQGEMQNHIGLHVFMVSMLASFFCARQLRFWRKI